MAFTKYPTPIIRTETEANFTAEDPVLEEGEISFCSDTLLIKVGDGSTAWTGLLAVGEAPLATVIGVPKACLSYINPSLTYTPKSYKMDASIDNGIDISDDATYLLTDNPMSFSFFIKAKDVTSLQVLVSRGSFSGNVGWYCQINNGYLEILHGNTMWVRAEMKGFLDRMVHVVLMHSGGLWRVYKNTIEVSYDLQESDDPLTCVKHLMFGMYDDYTNPFDGHISDIKIFSKELSQAEIDALYLGDESVATANLIGWWRCNEGSGTDVIDSSVSDIDGTILGDVDNLHSGISPYTKVTVPGTMPKYIACLGGKVTNPLSGYIGQEIPDYGIDQEIIWYWKILV